MEDSSDKTDARDWLHFRSDKKKEFKISENTFENRRDTISVPKDFTVVLDDSLAPSSPTSEDKETRRRSKSHFSKLFHGLRSDSPTKGRSGSISAAGNEATPSKTPYDVSKKFVVSSPSNPAYEIMNSDSRSRLSLPEKKEVIEEFIEHRPTREDLVTRNILLMSDDLESLYWGPFALNRVTKLLAPAAEFKTLQDAPHNPLFTEVPRWTIDNGIHRDTPLKLRIEGAEKDILIYKENFLGKDHVNYIGKDKEGAPVVVSVSKEQKNNHYATIIRNKAHDLFGYMKSKHFNKVIKKVFLISPDKYKGISFKAIKDAEQDLSNFESTQFGVLYCKQGQVIEEDMFSNVGYSEHFTEFLNFLGSVIDLKGWDKFRGGLDVKSGFTGEKSVYTTFHDFEIMFHVAQFLPYSHTDRQQLERKRHLGNDVVVIVFQDDNSTPFVPGCINSEFNHVFIVVQYVPGKNTCYRVATVSKEDVPPFGPVFPADCVFEKGDIFREFLLAKMINGERAAMYAPDFAFKLSRTREALLTQIFDKFSKE